MDAGRLNGTPLGTHSPGGVGWPENGAQRAPAPAGARGQPTPAVGEGLADTPVSAEAEGVQVGAFPQVKSHGAIAAVPVILVNAVAFCGQLAFLHDHLPWPLAGQVMMAVALESIAIYLAFHAHLAQLANDSALGKRLAAYTFALLIAGLNYSHYAGPHWQPTFAAVAVALCSAISPWLWNIHSRRVSRDALLASGLIEPHALRLGQTRWIWHPLRSAKVMWLATWEGITDPRQAVTRWEKAATDAATEDAKRDSTMAATVRHKQTPAPATAGTAAPATSARQQPARKPASAMQAKRAKAERLLADGTTRTEEQVAELSGVSVRTVQRIKNDQKEARHLAAVPEEETG